MVTAADLRATALRHQARRRLRPGRRLVEGAGPALGQLAGALAEVSARPGEVVGRLRLSEAIERDMVQVRLTDPFRFVVVGAPGYLARHGTPQRPEELLRHECITFRSQTTGALYAWELERGKRSWRVPARGGVVTNDRMTAVSLAAEGLGLAYAFEPAVSALLRSGRLEPVLEEYAAVVPGYFLYFPRRAQRSPALRLFVEAARELAIRAVR